MAKIFDGFDTTGEEELGSFDPIPAGEYVAMIVKSEMKETSNKLGEYLSLQFKVTEGEFKNRVLFTNLNLKNQNEQTVQIARKALTSICKACGIVSIEDSEELHGIEMLIKVTIKKATPDFPAGNEIKNFKRMEEAAAGAGIKKPESAGAVKKGEVKSGGLPVGAKRKVTF